MSSEPQYLYANYIEFHEIWHIVVPHNVVYEQFREIERVHGLVQLGRLIYEKCHWPKKPDTSWFSLLRVKMEHRDVDQYLLVWTQKRFNPIADKPPVIKTQHALGLYPVVTLTSGFVMDPEANDAEKQGNRIIHRI